MAKQKHKQLDEIIMFFHCAKCLEEMPRGESPRTFQRIQTGWTKKGIQIWCVRHDREVVNLDFLGQKISYVENTETD